MTIRACTGPDGLPGWLWERRDGTRTECFTYDPAKVGTARIAGQQIEAAARVELEEQQTTG